MSKKKLLVLLLTAAVAFTAGYGATAAAWHQENHGYFKGGSEPSGSWDNVWRPSSRTWTGAPDDCWGGGGLAIPTAVNTLPEFVFYVTCKLWYGTTQDHIGAAFMISTMTGQKNINPPDSQVDEWIRRLNYANSRGWIRWNDSDSCTQPNTFYQTNRQDVGYYMGCATGGNSSIEISNGSQWYIIKRYCGNPVGAMPALHDDVAFNISGTSTVNNATNITVSPGQQITFRHLLQNGGPTATSGGISWTVQQRSASGTWSDTSLSGTTGTLAGSGSGSSTGTIGSQTMTVNEPPNTQICRRIRWSPDTQSGGSGTSTPACATVQLNFNLTPSIGVQITGASGPVSGNYAEQGDSVTFTYTVNNTGSTVSPTVTCTYRQATHTGHSTAAPPTTFTPSGANCAPSRTFPASTNTTVATETVALNTGNRSVCRSLTISPVTQSGTGSRSTQACVHVTTKPYFHMYGGDVSTGASVEAPAGSGTCTQNNQAAMAGWNRLSAGGWAGAGVQYAAYALSRIYEVASSTWGSAQAPAGLSFANTTTSDIPGGDFGGRFGSVPCIPDHYATKPTTLADNMSSQNLDSYGTGVYYNNGNMHFTAPGNVTTIDPGQETVIYVNGNVHLSTNVHYTGSWNPANVPIFRLIVRGNIYIDTSVTRLDGVFIAQPNGSSGGIIYTCASATPAPYTAPGTTNFPSNTVGARCGSKLTVNGSFIAKQVQLWRTTGTLRQSASGEANGSGNIAEVFNFSPALWINQPDLSGLVESDYDAIVSLPPVL